ncbi:DNA-binding MarR family transcriptional regulator [Streptomyces phaeoluteigriseus]
MLPLPPERQAALYGTSPDGWVPRRGSLVYNFSAEIIHVVKSILTQLLHSGASWSLMMGNQIGGALMTRTDSPRRASEAPAVPGELEDALSHLQCILVARRTRSNPEGVTWQQYDVLELLRIRGPMTPSVLSASLGVSRATTSKALRVLKDLGLVGQQTIGEDRRELTTSLTPTGESFLTRVAEQRRENARIVGSTLSPGERAMFVELCNKVADALEPHLEPAEERP